MTEKIEKPCSCTEPCGHYAWLEDPEYLAEDLTEPEDKKEEVTEEYDLRKAKDTSFKHKLFMNGQCVKCRGIIDPSNIPEDVYTVKGLLEFPLFNFNACNGTLYHIECPIKK
jgi:hypothetical protein